MGGDGWMDGWMCIWVGWDGIGDLGISGTALEEGQGGVGVVLVS